MRIESSAIDTLIKAPWRDHVNKVDCEVERFIDWVLSEIKFPIPEDVPNIFEYDGKPLFIRPYGSTGMDLPLIVAKELAPKISWMQDFRFALDLNRDKYRKRFDEVGLQDRDGNQIESNSVSNHTYSHIFDNTTKNPFAYNSIWNVCRTPFFVDRFTGHEIGNWEHKEKFIKPFQNIVYSSYKKHIDLYDDKMIDLLPNLLAVLDNNKVFDVSEFRLRCVLNYRPMKKSALTDWLNRLRKSERLSVWNRPSLFKSRESWLSYAEKRLDALDGEVILDA